MRAAELVLEGEISGLVAVELNIMINYVLTLVQLTYN